MEVGSQPRQPMPTLQAEQQGKGEHLTAHEQSRQALEHDAQRASLGGREHARRRHIGHADIAALDYVESHRLSTGIVRRGLVPRRRETCGRALALSS